MSWIVDGSNVLAFHYQWRGQKFLTYKLRLAAVIRNSRFGPFLDLWQEILRAHPDAVEALVATCNSLVGKVTSSNFPETVIFPMGR